ncbi:beta-ketoacyl-ACP reductase [Halocatena halophila]|uniref:beta-ketoacyl-ACP reductase n=1 Tax=Halocatena halophila TaxID=2814576 RepID=UPI002ED59C90
MDLNHKTCVVTGGSRGIGRAIAIEFASAGANVVVNYQSSERAAHSVVEAIDMETDGEAITVQGDITDETAMESLRESAHHAFGPVDVLVNNAGITADRTFKNMTRSQWDEVIEVNLGGVFNCTQAFYTDLCNASEGRVINISSMVGLIGNYGQANYAAAKSGLLGFTRTLALEVASSGTTVNCIAPGFVQTDMLEQVPDDVQKDIIEQIPLERFASPEEIAGLARYLACSRSGYMTGQIVPITGGMEW